jgi:hypothetical protein
MRKDRSGKNTLTLKKEYYLLNILKVKGVGEEGNGE